VDRPGVTEEVDFYGAGIFNEKGHAIIPAELRKIFGVNAGERLLVMAAHR
jgi:hypothetical protein